MSALTSDQIFKLWEQGRNASHPEQGHLLLCAAFPETPPEELRLLTLGQRNAVILRLRELTLGPELDCVADCGACGAAVRASVSATDLLAGGPGVAAPHEQQFDEGVWQIRFRPVNGQDLMAIRACRDAESAEAELLSRCILVARKAGTELRAADVPRGILAKLGRILAEAEPLSDMALSFECPECGGKAEAAFDPVSYFWREISRLARVTANEVRHLGEWYGWEEEEILKMSPARRKLYLENLL